MNSTSFFYAHSDQWRYEKLGVQELLSPLADPAPYRCSMIDLNVRAEQMGWLPSAPQLAVSPLTLASEADRTEVAAKDYAAQSLKEGRIRMACADPDDPKNFPRNLFIWRSNLFGSSGKGHEYFLRHFLGTRHGLQGKDLGEVGGEKPTGLTVAQVEDMHRYLSIANYEDRFVIPTSHREQAEDAHGLRGSCGFTFGNGCDFGPPHSTLFGGKMGRRTL
jgi:nitrate reductase alpha subunit